MKTHEKIDAAILEITWHPDIRLLSEQCKKDIAIMVRELTDVLLSQQGNATDKIEICNCHKWKNLTAGWCSIHGSDNIYYRYPM